MRNVVSNLPALTALVLFTLPHISDGSIVDAVPPGLGVLPVPQALGPQKQNTPTKEQKIAAIHDFKNEISNVYKKNGQPDFFVTQGQEELSACMEKLCRAFDPNFDAKSFLAKDFSNRITVTNDILRANGCCFSQVAVISPNREGSQAIATCSLETIFDRDKFNCEKFDFTDIGTAGNPIGKEINLYFAKTVVPDAEGVLPLNPASCLVFNRGKGAYSISFSQDSFKFYIPDLATITKETFDPNLKNFVANWALARMAFQFGKEDGINKLPKYIKLDEGKASLVNSVSLYFALEKQEILTADMAILVFNYLKANFDDPECAHTCSQLNKAIENCDIRYPEMKNLSSTQRTCDFFRDKPEAAQSLLHGIKAHLKKEVDQMKAAVEEQQKREEFLRMKKAI